MNISKKPWTYSVIYSTDTDPTALGGSDNNYLSFLYCARDYSFFKEMTQKHVLFVVIT